MGLVDQVKSKLNIGNHDDAPTNQGAPTSTTHHQTTAHGQKGPMSGQTTGGVGHASGTGHHTTGHSTGTHGHSKCNQDHEHTMACGMGMHEHGKQDAWSHAHSKTHEASKHANASELAACKAQEHYENLTESQKNADNARRRHQELESELERLRGQGGDLSGHQRKLEEHKRHLADLENQHAMAIKAAKEKDHLAGHREREAGKLGDLHARKQQGLSPIEAELENLRRERENAHSNHQTLLAEHNDRHKKHQARAGEIDRHNNELLTHGNKVKELEAELAAAKERANKHHHHLMGLKDEHEGYERDLPNHQKRLDHASSRIELLKQKEGDLMRQHGAYKDDLDKHRGALTDAQRAAQEHRGAADDARRHAGGLPEQLEQHKAGLSQAQQEYGSEARRQKELDAQAHKLGGHLDKARAHADQADKTTAMHSDNLEQARREAEMHAERKEHAWNEAQEAGKGGSSLEGSHLTHLKEKIKDMGPGHTGTHTSTTSHHQSVKSPET